MVDALHLLAFPEGETLTRMSRSGRLRSDLRDGRWSLEIEGHDGETELEAAPRHSPLHPAASAWTPGR